jgi:hypothetical protein
VLRALLTGAQTVLGGHFVGMYLYGSLASGGFDQHRSDVDFVVVTADALPEDMVPALEAMHTRLATSGLKWAPKLEGAYVPQRVLRRHDSSAAPCPTLNEGCFYVAPLGSDWVIQRHILREHGAVLAGPSPQDLIDPVPPDELQRAVQAVLHEWWLPILQERGIWLYRSEYQAYAVLTMCRALHTLQHGSIVSKPAAARWAQSALGEPWAELIERALTWQPDSEPGNLDQTLDFIRYTLEHSQHPDDPNGKT